MSTSTWNPERLFPWLGDDDSPSAGESWVQELWEMLRQLHECPAEGECGPCLRRRSQIEQIILFTHTSELLEGVQEAECEDRRWAERVEEYVRAGDREGGGSRGRGDYETLEERLDDSGGSSFLCTCEGDGTHHHHDWCGAGNLPGNDHSLGGENDPLGG